jgi:hypothetical protein
MGTPTRNQEIENANFQWNRLCTALNLSPSTATWSDVIALFAQWRVISDGAEAEINRLKVELAEARSGVLVPAF